LKARILQRKSISLCFKEYNAISSGIVGGICPVALGVALALKRQGSQQRVFCFIGDMSAETGIFAECWKYGFCNKLPITWIVADNGKSVCTDTKKSWGMYHHSVSRAENVNVHYFQYKLGYPHAGGNSGRVNF
jgi:TPP-dependent pyruvate/acetoin dehydrogenase alpha subunit